MNKSKKNLMRVGPQSATDKPEMMLKFIDRHGRIHERKSKAEMRGDTGLRAEVETALGGSNCC